ncbi:PadR family transcriptional regulator [Spirillospora sp. NPDC029432]|uniref:PadR family transcriptional regulator n=1 Tax=Spirillospora sp. NPDC029432 TaxID=3154599 RepID=UPI0034546E38
MREFLRGAIRLHILHHAAKGEIHGAWMTRELAGHGYRISPGTLYPTLHRLEADGLLVSEQRVVEGRMRRVYAATEAGRAALAEDRAALRELAREVLGEGTTV